MKNQTQIDRDLAAAYPRARARWRAWLRSRDGRETLARLKHESDTIRATRSMLFWRTARQFAYGAIAAAAVLSGAVALLAWLARNQ